VGRKQSADESFIVSADLLVARGQTGAVQILGDRQGEGQFLHIEAIE
jgi:hypothetical protein